uniref:39S ribosomal protein L48, mitochondrial n=1 Tax=Scatophagus argus TaxID=75038 RepID=UPI001ED7FC36|nr:39S ribosomal protein L48, mitochondrial [Scatophagus argus]
MNSVLRKLQVSVTQQASVFNQAFILCRATPSVWHPVWAFVNERQYRRMPTHGIGRWKYLMPKLTRKKKKDRHQMKPLMPATDTEYGTLNVKVSGYDMTLVEHYSQYIHKFCNRLGIKLAECYALPTKSTEVLLEQEQGAKLYVDAILKTHERVIQLSSLNALLCPVFMEVLLKNQPEGIQLSIMEHTEADFQARFKKRPDLEELLAQMNH